MNLVNFRLKEFLQSVDISLSGTDSLSAVVYTYWKKMKENESNPLDVGCVLINNLVVGLIIFLVVIGFEL